MLDPENQLPSSTGGQPSPDEKKIIAPEVPAAQPEQLASTAETPSSTSKPAALTSAAPEPAPFHRWVDTVNKLFQIVAILFAGAWAIFVFLETVAPTLGLKVPLDSEIHWAKIPNTELCQARIEFTVKNEGQVPFEITNVALKGSIIELNQEMLSGPSANKPLFLDPLENVPQAGTPFPLANNSLSRDLSGQYPAGSHVTSAVTYLFKRPKNNNTIVAVQADASGWSRTGILGWAQKEPLSNYTYAVDQVCGATWDENLRSQPKEGEKPESKSKQ